MTVTTIFLAESGQKRDPRSRHDSDSFDEKKIIKREKQSGVLPVKILGAKFDIGLKDLRYFTLFSNNTTKLVPR